MKTLARILKWLIIAVVALAIAAACIWGRELSTILSVRQVDAQGYLYEMDYNASYDLDDIVEADIDSNTKLLQYVIGKLSRGIYKAKSVSGGNNIDFACTSFQVRSADGDGWLFGRNYDYFKNPTLVVHSHPKDGYASLSACDMSHFGYSLEKLPDSFTGKALCLAGVYAPMDGINEKGLCVSIMALPKQPSQQSTGKHCVGTTIFMRLLLDRCATVEEALELASSVDIRHDVSANSGYHYMVADASGDCAVIEFDKEDGWKTMVVRKDPGSNYMHVTNHLLSPKYYTEEPDPAVGNPHSRSWWRYDTVRSYMDEHDGTLTSEQAQECLALVHWDELVWDNGTVESTQFSNLYDQSALTLVMHPWEDYTSSYSFSLR